MRTRPALLVLATCLALVVAGAAPAGASRQQRGAGIRPGGGAAAAMRRAPARPKRKLLRTLRRKAAALGRTKSSSRPVAAVAVATAALVAAPAAAVAPAPSPSRRAKAARAGRQALRLLRGAPRAIGTGIVQAATWARRNPGTAALLAAGSAAMLATVILVAPALNVAAAGFLAPTLGVGAAGIAGIGLGGALASGVRSFMVHVTPMAIGKDPWNHQQLALDVGMSTGFGFLGFAQAALLTTLTGSVAVGAVATGATMLVGLVGWELVKDYIQIHIRNRVATYPKDANDPATFKKVVLLEALTNAHRALPGLSTSYIAKVAGDIIGTVFWDRVVNAPDAAGPDAARERIRARSQKRVPAAGAAQEPPRPTVSTSSLR